MNKMEERHLNSINYVRNGMGQVTRRIIAEHCAAITKEVAIGFKDWFDIEVRTSFTHIGTRSMYFGKSDSELFEMYLNTLK